MQKAQNSFSEGSPIIIDVRDDDEFDSEHALGAIHLPLKAVPAQGAALLSAIDGKPVLLMCKSGLRSGVACAQLKSYPNVTSFEGGIDAWKAQGKPVVGAGKKKLPLMRQTLLGAGLLVLSSLLLAWQVSPKWLALTAFVGTGLTVAGATGFCMMAIILSKLPYNKRA